MGPLGFGGSRLARLSVAGAALWAAAFGCSKHQTEAIVVVTTAGVRIPTDLHKVRFIVKDRAPAGDDEVFNQDVNLCHEALSTGCFEVPVSAVLFPGKSRGSDSVRIQIDAIGGNEMPVISNAAVFTFAEEQSLRLDFVLYANCIGNIECAKRDQACGPNDTCVDVVATNIHGAPDLGKPAPYMDMAMSMPDMTLNDLAGADLVMTPADLTTQFDMAGCASVSCQPTEVCVAGMCQHCGDQDERCCQGPSMMREPSPNGVPLPTGQCNFSNLVCDGTNCVRCGMTGQLCCGGAPGCFDVNDACDLSDHCAPTGGGGSGGGGGGGGPPDF